MLICIAAFRITCYAHIFNRELGLESLAERRVSRKIFFFRKTINGLFPAYLQLYISQGGEVVHKTRSENQNNLRTLSTKAKTFESSFFPYCIKEWNNASEELQ